MLDEFLRSNSQRALSVNSILARLEDEVLLLDFLAPCMSNHESIRLVKLAIYSCVNILLNNYCFMKNDLFGAAKFQKEKNWQLFNNLCVLYNTLQLLSIHYCVVLKCVFFSFDFI